MLINYCLKLCMYTPLFRVKVCRAIKFIHFKFFSIKPTSGQTIFVVTFFNRDASISRLYWLYYLQCFMCMCVKEIYYWLMVESSVKLLGFKYHTLLSASYIYNNYCLELFNIHEYTHVFDALKLSDFDFFQPILICISR